MKPWRVKVDDVALLTISIVQECRVDGGIHIPQFPSRLFRNATAPSFGIGRKWVEFGDS